MAPFSRTPDAGRSPTRFPFRPWGRWWPSRSFNIHLIHLHSSISEVAVTPSVPCAANAGGTDACWVVFLVLCSGVGLNVWFHYSCFSTSEPASFTLNSWAFSSHFLALADPEQSQIWKVLCILKAFIAIKYLPRRWVFLEYQHRALSSAHVPQKPPGQVTGWSMSFSGNLSWLQQDAAWYIFTIILLAYVQQAQNFV